MICAKAYAGDNNTYLQRVQHDCYFHSIVRMFEEARRTFLYADTLLMTKLELAERVRAVDGFDHRVLQAAHDILAARYRYLHDDGGQLRLLDQRDLDEAYLLEWSRWRDSQFHELAMYPEFVRSVIEAVMFANTVFGGMAETRLCDLLSAHVAMGDWGIAYPSCAAAGR